jgi:hypothetical protein
MPLGANKAAIMGVAGVSTGDVVLLSTQTADGDSTISFTSGIDSTYGEYIFRFYNINPATDDTGFQFQFNASSQSGYNETLTTTMFRPYHTEADGSGLGYITASDQAQGTAFQGVNFSLSSDADSSCAGELHLFNPASTTYVKHFYSRSSTYSSAPGATDFFVAGYVNTTSAITDVQFKSSSGNFDGTIKLWGVK